MTCYPRLASGDRPFSRSPESIKSNSISCHPLDQSLFAYYDRILHWLKQPLTLLVYSLSIASKTILLVLFAKTTLGHNVRNTFIFHIWRKENMTKL